LNCDNSKQKSASEVSNKQKRIPFRFARMYRRWRIGRHRRHCDTTATPPGWLAHRHCRESSTTYDCTLTQPQLTIQNTQQQTINPFNKRGLSTKYYFKVY